MMPRQVYLTAVERALDMKLSAAQIGRCGELLTQLQRLQFGIDSASFPAVYSGCMDISEQSGHGLVEIVIMLGNRRTNRFIMGRVWRGIRR